MELTIKSLLKSIQRDQPLGINVDFLPSMPSISKKEIRDFEKRTEIDFPQSLKKCYGTLNGWSIYSSYRDELVQFAVGNCNLLSVRDLIFGNPFGFKKSVKDNRHLGFLYKIEQKDEAFAIYDKHYYLLDVVSHIDHVYTLISFKESQPEIVMVHYPFVVSKLTLSLEEYITNSLINRARLGWQNAFLESSKNTTLEPLQLPDTDWPSILQTTFLLPDTLQYFGADYRPEQINHNILELCKSFHFKKSLKTALTAFNRQNPHSKLKLNNSQWNSDQDISQTVLNPLTIKMVEKEIDRKLPDAVIAFYLQINGLMIQWEINDQQIHGHTAVADGRFLTFYAAFGGTTAFNRSGDVDYFKNVRNDDLYATKEDKEFSKQCALIYISEFTNVYINLKDEDCNLWSLVHGNFYPLKMNIQSFFSHFIEVLGLNYWAQFLHRTEVLPDSFLEQCAPFNPFADAIFKDNDLSAFRTVKTGSEILAED